MRQRDYKVNDKYVVATLVLIIRYMSDIDRSVTLFGNNADIFLKQVDEVVGFASSNTLSCRKTYQLRLVFHFNYVFT